MKSIQFIYEDTEIHFLVNPDQDHVMVNATEMAKVFGRRTKDFLKTDETKSFIEVANRALNGAQIIQDRGRNGIYFDRFVGCFKSQKTIS
ncbi:MAG: KilA-N domain-containing protein [Weeksellaceae bacterium]